MHRGARFCDSNAWRFENDRFYTRLICELFYTGDSRLVIQWIYCFYILHADTAKNLFDIDFLDDFAHNSAAGTGMRLVSRTTSVIFA